MPFGDHLDGAVDDLNGRLFVDGAGRIAEVNAKVREVAAGSVRIELGGLFLVGIGSIISTLPAVFGWQ